MRINPAALATLAFTLAVADLTGQVYASSSTQRQFKPEELCTVEGTVVSSTTGEPVKKVAVAIYPAGVGGQQHSTITDSSGHFLLRAVEPGAYSMQAGGNGYPFQFYGRRSPGGRGKVVSLAPGQHERDLLFRLVPGAVITGAVYDEDDDPAIGATVQALRLRSTRSGQSIPSAMSSAQTNDRGEYRLYGLEPGPYVLVADFQNQIVSDNGRLSEFGTTGNEPTNEIYLPSFYPTGSDPSQAVPIQVRPGSEVSAIDLTLRRVRGVRVRGHVLNEGGSLPQGFQVQLGPRDAGRMYGNRSHVGAIQNEKGDFEIQGVPPGSYILSGSWNDANQSYSGRAPVDVDSADIEGISLVLSPGMDLQGSIRSDPDAKLNFTQLNLWLQPEDEMPGGSSAQIRAGGSFVVHDLQEGNYRVRLGGYPEQFYLKTARLGGADVLDSGLSIVHGQAPGSLELELTQNGGSVSGTVLQGQSPAAAAYVILVPDPPNRKRQELYSAKTSDQFGRFTMLGLPPGDFKLFAFEDMEAGAAEDPEFLKPYESRGKPVHIQEKQEQTVQLELIASQEEPQ
jgi:hypothetical protein